MTAGESAAEQARKMREKADWIRRAADNWERGAAGERRIGAILEQLPSEFVVFHDLQLPGSRANVDHLVVSSNGIWAVDAKNYTYAVRRGTDKGAGTLWSGKRALTKTIRTSAWEASVVAELIGYHVTPVMCVIAPSLPSSAFEFDGVRICTPGRLADELATDSDEIDVPAAVAAVRTALGTDPAVRAERVAKVPERSAEAVASAPKHSGDSRARRRMPKGAVPVLKLVAVAAGLIAGATYLPRASGAMGDWLGGRIADDLRETATSARSAHSSAGTSSSLVATTSPATPETALTVGDPPSPKYVVVCDEDGQSVMVNILWPGEPPAGVAVVGARVRRGVDEARTTLDAVEWSDGDTEVKSVALPLTSAPYWIAIEYLDENGLTRASTEEPLRVDAAAC